MAAPRARRSGKKTGASAGGERRPPSKEGREFVAEAEEILEQLCGDLCLLHEQRHAGGELEPDLVNRLFRSAHTLKGLAGLFGQGAVSRLAHRLEDVLDGLRLGRIDPRAPVVSLLDDGAAMLIALMTEVDRDGSPSAGSTANADAFLAGLDRALAAPSAPVAPSAPPAPEAPAAAVGLDPAILRALTEYEEHRLRENQKRGRPIVLIDSTFDLSAFEDGLAEISAAVREAGEIISTLPSASTSADRKIRFTLLVATDLAPDQLARRIGPALGSVRLALPAAAARPGAPGGDAGGDAVRNASNGAEPSAQRDPGHGAATETAAAAVGAEEALPDESRDGDGDGDPRRIESLRSISGSVRVDIGKLDLLMNLVGELVIHRNALGQIVSRLSGDARNARVGADLAKVHKLLDRRLKDLQAGVLDVRMVPLRQVFEKLSRVVRRLRIDLEKEALLEFTGGDTELDKLIVEQLVDPLIHVVRNAFDHALESAEERVAAGKPAVGRIRVAAFQRGNHVVLEVSDDGRGMDVDAIRKKAIARGIVSEQAVLSEREILNLVFEAGLSTRESVSETSGRGVGMDVVRSNLAALGGLVELASRRGQGTTITITLPITLAIIQALIVRAGGERFAIPLASVRETLCIDDHPILRSEDKELIDLRGAPLLVRRLADELELAGDGAAARAFVVVLGMGEQRLGLVVDALEGQQDIVIKPIQGPVQPIPGIAGATELGDRVVLLVVDVSSLMADASRRREAA